MTKLFISYATEDAPYAQELAEALRKQNVEVALDMGSLDAGSDWRHAVTQEMESSDGIVAVVSPKSLSARNPLIEVGMAWSMGKKILPVVAPGSSLGELDLPPPLQEVQMLQAHELAPMQLASELASFVGGIGKGRL